VKSRILLVKAAFVLAVSESYRYSYTSELCGALSIYEVIDYILLSSSYTLLLYYILIGSDCSAMIDKLRFTSLIIPFMKHLSHILWEICMISKHWNIRTILIKIRGHQDNLLPVYQLSKLKKMNIWCNLQAKQLIK